LRKPIFSSRADDPEVSELIDDFMVSLAEQVDGLQDAEANGNLTVLAELTSILATRAEGLGFGVLAAAAGDLESCCQTDQIEESRDALIELTDIAKCIRMGHRGAV
jgi:hypothetical protein